MALGGVPGNMLCPGCHEGLETVFHAIWGCRSINAFWKHSSFRYVFVNLDPNDPLGLLIHAGRVLADSDFSLFIVLCWQAWNLRNSFVHKTPIPPDEITGGWCSEFLKDYLDAGARVKQDRHVDRSAWQPPSAGSFKVNVDATVKRHAGGVGLGTIIRNCFGHVAAPPCEIYSPTS